METQQSAREIAATLEAPERTGLSGWKWLVVHGLWAVIAVLAITLFLVRIGARVEIVHLVDQGFAEFGLLSEERQALRQLQLSPLVYKQALIVLEVAYSLWFFLVAIFIRWRKPNEWMPSFVSMVLLLMGGLGLGMYTGGLRTLLAWQPWFFREYVMEGLVLAASGILFLLFPTGRFVPRWSWLVALIWLA
ncbi:MAG: hypothetical protein M3220_00615 [Chloroflexota bacterium]|nr:hypothetical protein [Chloroflexota bacterium]